MSRLVAPSLSLSLALSLALFLAGCTCGAPSAGAGETVLRVGHFPNVTHVHGVLAHGATRRGAGWFEARLGPGVRIEWFVFNAGPAAMEALLAGSIDLTYVGPNPALNAHIRSRGDEVRVIAGATLGGSALVVRAGSGIASASDLRGRHVGTPQFGNTQDVSCRAWLIDHGLRVTQTGGDVLVVPTQNPDQLSLMARGDLDAVWTVEPWVSRLEMEAGATVLVEEPAAVTTVLACSRRFLETHRDLAQRFVAAHRELTAWIETHPDDARAGVRDELSAETRGTVPATLVENCWPRMRFVSDVTRASFESFLDRAVRTGMLAESFPLDRFVEEP